MKSNLPADVRRAARRSDLAWHATAYRRDSMRIEPPAARYTFSTSRGVTVDGDLGVYPGEPEAPDDGLVRLWFYSSASNRRPPTPTTRSGT